MVISRVHQGPSIKENVCAEYDRDQNRVLASATSDHSWWVLAPNANTSGRTIENLLCDRPRKQEVSSLSFVGQTPLGHAIVSPRGDAIHLHDDVGLSSYN
jgi:hypothetical protein